jgi:adenosylmethionine-8-amino-7-oxononanoate aminotransferase
MSAISTERRATELPVGDLDAWDKRHFWHGFTQMAEYEPFIIQEARGCELTDVHGRRYLDGVSSLWCNIHGHRHPRLDEAIRDQLGRVAHVTSLGMGCEITVRLAKRLADLAPGDLDHVFFSDSGSTAVEAGLKMALQFWQQCSPSQKDKRTFVTFDLGYHGDTVGSLSLGGIPRFRDVFGSLLFDTLRLPAPDTYRLPTGVPQASACDHYLSLLETALKEQHASIAAVVLEPLVQGAGGMIMQPRGFLQGVRRLTSRYNVLLILDEVAVGMGRTGTMFACEHEQVVPDLLCLAKGLTGGYLPLAATIATSRIWEAFRGRFAEARTFYHGHTYGGNPLGAAVAIASLDVFDEEQTLCRLEPLVERLRYHLQRLTGLPGVGDARQCGLIGAIELVRDRDTKDPFPWQEQRGARACRIARQHGVWLRPLGDVIVIMPPLCVTLDQLDRIMEAAEAGIRGVMA